MNAKYLIAAAILIVILVISIYLLQAREEKFTVSIDVLPENIGTTSPLQGDYSFEKGEFLEITQKPSMEAKFLHWQVNGKIIKEEKLRLRVDSDKNIIATYIPIETLMDAEVIGMVYNTT